MSFLILMAGSRIELPTRGFKAIEIRLLKRKRPNLSKGASLLGKRDLNPRPDYESTTLPLHYDASNVLK